MTDKIKIKVSSFVANILENDALRFGFTKNGNANKNALLNKLIPTLVEETDKIQNAQKARCADFETGNIFKRAKAMIPIMVPLFISAFRRAEELAMAMESRCYRGGVGRTRLNRLIYKKGDFIAFSAGIIFLIICILL